MNDGNATQAAIDAGYSAKTAAAIGAENLRKPQIAAAIEEHQARLRNRWILTADKKQEVLAKIIDRSMQISAATDTDGKAAFCEYDPKTAIAAIQEHNRMTGDLATIKTENQNVAVTHEEWLSQLN